MYLALAGDNTCKGMEINYRTVKNRSLLLVFIVLISCKQAKHKLVVKEIANAMDITKGWALLTTDSVFHLGPEKYLIRTMEFFDDKGEVTHVMTWDALGYVDWHKKDFDSMTQFLEEHDMKPEVSAYLLDNERLVVNADTVLIKQINTKDKIIYYHLKSDWNLRGPRRLHRISYQ
jgi:hypothetical protein